MIYKEKIKKEITENSEKQNNQNLLILADVHE
jgi:hypothetical protein